ncbi:MAG: signal peptidase II [Deltaproteobacteria bacterium]|nr:MAG: signal peptidase II [Deltaproteobacteria bacterium]
MVFATGVVVDQVTKWLVIRYIGYRTEEIVVIPDFFSLVHARNTGAAFGFLDDFQYRMLVFAAFTIVAVAVLIHMVWQLPAEDRFQTVALALIAAGAIGNAIDRVYNTIVNGQMYVTDFMLNYVGRPESVKRWLIDTFGTNEWPAWNVADACIVVGIGLFLVYYLFIQEDEDVAPEPPSQPSSDLPPIR